MTEYCSQRKLPVLYCYRQLRHSQLWVHKPQELFKEQVVMGPRDKEFKINTLMNYLREDCGRFFFPQKIIAKSRHKSGYLLSWSKGICTYVCVSVLNCARDVWQGQKFSFCLFLLLSVEENKISVYPRI